jgi:hypothetical protein
MKANRKRCSAISTSLRLGLDLRDDSIKVSALKENTNYA